MDDPRVPPSRGWVWGTNGDDHLWGGHEANFIVGFGGNDSITTGRGPDWIDGGDGFDLVSYVDSSEVPVYVDLVTGRGYGGTAEGDTLINIENLTGSDGGDTFIGTDGDNQLYGDGGDDHFWGAGGKDVLAGDAGDDVLEGGAGPDTLYGDQLGLFYTPGSDTAAYRGSPAGVFVSLETWTFYEGDAEGDALYGIENLIGSAHDDVLEGSSATNNRLEGLDGKDTLRGFDGADILEGGEGDDFLYGMYDGDFLDGGADRDFLSGGTHGDMLWGGDGPDTLVGGPGADQLNGGTGADLFRFDEVEDNSELYGSVDWISDFFEADGDMIDVSIIDANSRVPGDQAFRWIGNDNAFVEAWGPGQLRFNHGYLEGDVDGDMYADFRVQMFAPPIHEYSLVL